ncbi:MAG: recombinase family protein [Candidatus Accumulibacter sp.]|nr:recombinase family protein [Accumulibacter sp.]
MATATGKYIAYLRVSTQKQGTSGLGIEAQREAVKNYLNGGQWELLAEHVEVETGKGSDALAKRPQLRAALEACKKAGATLVIAKLDRLARNVHFISGLMESKVKFVACDLPEANTLTLHLMAAFAEHEAKRISERTKDALAAAKARGVQLGLAGPANLRPNIEERQEAADAFANNLRHIFTSMQERGLSQREMARELNQIALPAPTGGAWMQMQVRRVLARLEKAPAA